MMIQEKQQQNDPDHDTSPGHQVKIYPRVVSVSGDNVVKDIKDFNEAGFQPLLMKNLSEAGYKTPTPVQRYTIPIITAGRDLMVTAETGTGRAAAFLLPIINKLICSNKGTPV